MSISIYNGVTDEKWTIAYDDSEIQIAASNRRFYHGLSVRDEKGFRGNHPFEIFFRLLNEFVWFSSIRVDDLNGGHGEYSANLNFRSSDDSYLVQLKEFQQRVTTRDQHLALGFFREGVSSDSAFYQFICYAKILEIPFKDGKAKGEWIDQSIASLQGDKAVSMRDSRISLLGGKSLGKWLQEDGRNALSHANMKMGSVVRDPNSFKDWDEIKAGNDVMRELAERILVEELHIPVGNAATSYMHR